MNRLFRWEASFALGAELVFLYFPLYGKRTWVLEYRERKGQQRRTFRRKSFADAASAVEAFRLLVSAVEDGKGAQWWEQNQEEPRD